MKKILKEVMEDVIKTAPKIMDTLNQSMEKIFSVKNAKPTAKFVTAKKNATNAILKLSYLKMNVNRNVVMESMEIKKREYVEIVPMIV